MFEKMSVQILRKLLKELIKAGHDVTIDYERGYYSSGVTEKDGIEKMIEAAQAVDEVWIMVDRDGDAYETHVLFIWENGAHAISDYGMSLDPIISPICEAADKAAYG